MKKFDIEYSTQYTPEKSLIDLQERDLFKKNYALNNNYFYLEIPYWTEKDESYKKLIDNKNTRNFKK